MFEYLVNILYPLGMSPKMSTDISSLESGNNEITELPDGPADEHGLTTRQLKILQAIKSALVTNGYPPSMREIGAAATCIRMC